MPQPVHHLLRLIYCASALVLTTNSKGQELPNWKFTAGDKANYRFTLQAELSQGSAETLKPLATVHQQIDYLWEVTKVTEDGTATVAVEVEDFQLKILGPGGKEVEFSVDATDEPQGFAAMLLPLGKQLREGRVEFTMAPSGELTLAELPENLGQAIKSIPGGKAYSADGGEASFANLVRLGGWGFPLESDKAGIWQESVAVEPEKQPPFTIALQYRLLATEESGVSRIEKKMILIAVPDSALQIAEQTSDGIILFVDDLGRPIKAEHSLDAELENSEMPAQRIKLELAVKYQQLDSENNGQ